MGAVSTVRELTVQSGEVTLAGTLWAPDEDRPTATVVMHPGSGPSDRNNDILFPPIREHLLEAGFAVCSFDKRGVGGSTGRWQDAAIAEQADDLLASVAAVRSDTPHAPVGIFGHSQGGWVVVEAAGRRPPIAFAVTNSGPGVTPAAQERYAARLALERAGIEVDRIEIAMRGFDHVIAVLREGLPAEAARARVEQAGLDSLFAEVGLPFLPDDPAEWEFARALLDYDPRPSLERIRVPLLALFGREDSIVPLEESVRVYRATVARDLLRVAVFEGADHRMQVGDPKRFADGYLETLASFVREAIT